MKRLIFVILSLLICSFSNAHELKSYADSIYMAEKYSEALLAYDSLARLQGYSAEVYYNIGNSYYKLDDIAHAVLYYERALMLSPGDDDIRFNLELARSKTIDKIIPHHEIFLVTWWRSFVNITGSDNWATTALVLFVVMLLLFFVFLFASQVWVQQLCFFTSIICFVMCIITNIAAWQQNAREEERSGAIVMSAAAVVRSTPAKSGTDLFVLHEGTRVDITDNTMNDWKEIVIADGKRGWIESCQIERI